MTDSDVVKGYKMRDLIKNVFSFGKLAEFCTCCKALVIKEWKEDKRYKENMMETILTSSDKKCVFIPRCRWVGEPWVF